MKKVLALILALLMMVALFAACNGDKPNDGKEQQDEQGQQGEDKPNDQQSEIVIKKFDGADYTILAKQDTKYEFEGSLGGDYVQQAVAQRTFDLENNFDVNYRLVPIPGDWGKRGEFKTAVLSEKMSGGTDGYDLIATHSIYLGWMGIEGLGKDMSLYSDYIHFDKPWWNQNIYDELNLKGHVFMMIGDIAHTLYEYITVMFVNEAEFENYFSDDGGTEMLYEMVREGEWTWSKLWEYASDFGTGASGDGKYGLATNAHAWRATFVSQEASLFERNSEGKLSLPNTLRRKESDIIREMTEYYAKDNIDFNVDWSIHAQYNDDFTAGNILFYPQTLDQAKKLFSSENRDDYGVIPLPKYDTDQEMYKTQCRDTVTGVMLMCTTKDPERTAILTEAMAYYGHEYVVPAYYDVSLSTRYLDQYTDILETIRAGLTYQPWDAYIQPVSGDGNGGTMRWDKFHLIVRGNGAQADAAYQSSLSVGRSELDNFYKKLALLGIVYD